jgi:hypothetical protein
MADDALGAADDPDADGTRTPAPELLDDARLRRASTPRLLALARAADRELMQALEHGTAGAAEHRPSHSRAALLLAIYAIVNRRLARAPLDARTFLPVVRGIAWDAGSPAAGDIADVPPFGNAPLWAALALGLPRPSP